MIKLNDLLPIGPTGKATVIYIHPYGRFYNVRYDFPKGSYVESIPFTPAEREEGYRLGIFKQASSSSSPKRGREAGNPFDAYDDPREYDISTLMAMM